MVSLVFVITFFAAALVVCHLPILWIRWFRRKVISDKDRWATWVERSDYLYLALAAIALIPAANDLERFDLRSRLNFALYQHFSGVNVQLKRENLYGTDFNALAKMHPKSARYFLDNMAVLRSGDLLLDRGLELLRGGQYREGRFQLHIAAQKYDALLLWRQGP